MVSKNDLTTYQHMNDPDPRVAKELEKAARKRKKLKTHTSVSEQTFVITIRLVSWVFFLLVAAAVVYGVYYVIQLFLEG